MDGLEEFIVEPLVLILLGLHSHSELLLEMRVLPTHQFLNPSRLLHRLGRQSQLLLVVAIILPPRCHLLILLVGPVVLEQGPHD